MPETPARWRAVLPRVFGWARSHLPELLLVAVGGTFFSAITLLGWLRPLAIVSAIAVLAVASFDFFCRLTA